MQAEDAVVQRYHTPFCMQEVVGSSPAGRIDVPRARATVGHLSPDHVMPNYQQCRLVGVVIRARLVHDLSFCVSAYVHAHWL